MTFTTIKIKKTAYPALLLLLCALIVSFNGCKKKKHSEMANILYNKTKNKVFRTLEPDDFADVFKNVIDSSKSTINHADVIAAYYSQNDYEPIFVESHFPNNDLNIMLDYYSQAGEHGLDSNMFQVKQIRELLSKINNKKAIKNLDQAYHTIARLELLTANSLINYSSALEFGLVNPSKIYARYFIVTRHPDSASMMQVFRSSSLHLYLDSIQPKDPQYVALQKAYMSGQAIPGLSQEESKRVLLVNLERLRWQNKPTAAKYVWVNIPDFRLDVMDSGKSVLNMKVCVGQGRDMNNPKSLMSFDDTDRVDKPNTHETPLLNSMIYMAQVNPVWNIPESIANKEIIKHAEDDPYYLTNNDIDVYKNGQKIEDTNDIDWSTADRDTYEFKQEPGAENSLGKIKFIFKNKSSVYLHDTPVKEAFDRTMRAVSHGCVRLQEPLELAHNLFGDGSKYNLIAKDMAEDNPDPTDISLPKKVPVYINYVTCWADENGTLQYRPDIYGLDVVLFANLEKVIGD